MFYHVQKKDVKIKNDQLSSQIIIQFNSIDAKLQLLKNRKEIGPLYVKQIIEDFPDADREAYINE